MRKYLSTFMGSVCAIGLLAQTTYNINIDVDYVGDRGMAFMNGELITDHFYHNKKWEISLKKSGIWSGKGDLLLLFHPMHSDYEYLGDLSKLPEFENLKTSL